MLVDNLILFKILGCKLSGPGDFVTFNLFRAFITSWVVISIVFSVSFGFIVKSGISFVYSTVKNWIKKIFMTLYLSSSLTV